jgi:hypothetical protein
MQPGRGRNKAIARLLSLGTIGAAAFLGSALPASATTSRAADDAANVGRRLLAIQEAVLTVDPAAPAVTTEGDVHQAWGYRWFNGPRRRWNNFRPRWNNFRPRWNNFWRNL